MKKRTLLSRASLALVLLAACAATARAMPTAQDSIAPPVPAPTSGASNSETPVPAPTPLTSEGKTSATTPTPLTTGSIWLGVNGGVGLPFGDFSDQASTGFNFGLTGDYMVYENLAVGGELGWHTFGGNDQLEKELSVEKGAPVQLTVRLIPLTAHAKYFLPAGATVTPFVRGALGLYSVKQKIEYGSTHDESSKTKIGIQFGGGANFKSTTSLLYGFDLLYHYVATEDKATSMITARGQLMFGLPRR